MTDSSKHEPVFDREGFRHGDEAAFRQAYDALYPRLMRMGARYHHDPMVIHDATTEAFIQFWQDRENIGNVRHTGNYLIASMKYKIINHIKKPDPLRQAAGFEDWHGQDPETPLQRLEGKQRTQLAHQAMDMMHPQQGKIMRMLTEGHTNADIAEQLNMRASSVRGQRARGLQHFQKIMDVLKAS